MADRKTANTAGAKPSFSVEDTFWGYIVRGAKGESMGFALLQSVSFLIGVAFLTAAVGIVTLSPLVFGAELSPFRIGASVLFGAAAAYLLWFASRGTRTEVHIDTSTREIREVIRNRAGRPTMVGTHDFETFTGIVVQEGDDSETAMLVLHDHDSTNSVCLAQAPQSQLVTLYDRVARDLLGEAQPRNGLA